MLARITKNLRRKDCFASSLRPGRPVEMNEITVYLFFNLSYIGKSRNSIISICPKILNNGFNRKLNSKGTIVDEALIAKKSLPVQPQEVN